VVEVNVPGTKAYGIVLGNVQNLVKAFAPESVQVEIVCEGAGIDMLFTEDNRIAGQLLKVQKLGVSFAACSNTMNGRHIDRTHIFSFAKVVDSGVAEVVRRQEQGWSYLKGAY
jgi:intracellular sulfur oxidation DsrE/DsrF family protein